MVGISTSKHVEAARGKALYASGSIGKSGKRVKAHATTVDEWISPDCPHSQQKGTNNAKVSEEGVMPVEKGEGGKECPKEDEQATRANANSVVVRMHARMCVCMKYVCIHVCMHVSLELSCSVWSW